MENNYIRFILNSFLQIPQYSVVCAQVGISCQPRTDHKNKIWRKAIIFALPFKQIAKTDAVGTEVDASLVQFVNQQTTLYLGILEMSPALVLSQKNLK